MGRWMGRWLVDAVGAPHHPQCRRWQVLVPSRRPTPLCTSTLFHGHLLIPDSLFIRPLASARLHPPASTDFLLLLHRLPLPSRSPIPNPPQPKAFFLLEACVSSSFWFFHDLDLRLLVASFLAIAKSINPQRQIRHLDDKPSQACRHPNLIGTDATDSPQQSTRERRVLLCLARSLQRSASACSTTSSSVCHRHLPPACYCTCHCFAANSSHL